MKKVLVIILIIFTLILTADRIYKHYSRSNVNSHEAIVLVNHNVDPSKADSFFNLEPGTFNQKNHRIKYGLLRKDASVLDKYINIPMSMNGSYNCEVNYQDIRGYNFYDYEVDNVNLLVRLVDKQNERKSITEKYLKMRFEYGKINIVSVGEANITISKCE
jgi:uncharacterized protein YxeA